MATTLTIWPKLVYLMTLRFRIIYVLRNSLRHCIICRSSFLAGKFLTQFVTSNLTSMHIASGVLQESYIWSSSFQYKYCNMFFEKCECGITSYADDSTPDICDSDLCTVLSKLKNCTDSLFAWF